MGARACGFHHFGHNSTACIRSLKPLPIMGMFYRWGVDVCKMPFKSVSGNKYVVVMIEHFSKWIKLVAIPDKTSHHTARIRKFIGSQRTRIIWYRARFSIYGVRRYSTTVLGIVPPSGSNPNSESAALDFKYRPSLCPGWSQS
jgi:hypothetical protein